MCSLNDDDEICGNLVSLEKSSQRELEQCRSCTNKAVVVLRKKDAYCKDCFLASETHKFRAALGKSKMMKPQDRVLVAFSGSQSSVALLHLLHSGVTEKHHKKILFSVSVLFVEEGVLFKKEIEERIKLVEDMKKKVEEYNFPIFISTISETFNELPVIDGSLKINNEYDKQFLELFENVKTISSKEDLLYFLRQKLILKCASQLNCNKIFTAEVGNDLAVKLLSNFSLGRGDQASFETSFCDDRFPHSKILRPLRDFLKKEITFYNRFNNLEHLHFPTFTTKQISNVSIQKLTEKFVMDLQEEFSSTVYTIFRTGEKLSVNKNENHDKGYFCLLCQDKLRTNSCSDYSAIKAINFSKSISSQKLKNCNINNKTNCCGNCSSTEEIIKEIKDLNLENNFCYGCSNIINDLRSMNNLPKALIHSAMQRKHLEQISEFLLEDS